MSRQSAGALGLRHWAAMLGAEVTVKPEPLYVVLDKRYDGRSRIVAKYVEPLDALMHADVLRRAGDPAQIELITSVRDAQ